MTIQLVRYFHHDDNGGWCEFTNPDNKFINGNPGKLEFEQKSLQQ